MEGGEEKAMRRGRQREEGWREGGGVGEVGDEV